MANIIDYLKWRGDITLRQDPLNKVDAMLFACISYVDFGGVVPEDDVEISFADACSRFFELHSEEELAADNSFISFAPSLFKEAAACARYRDLTMSRYVNHIDINDMIQFSAVTIRLSEDEVFIACQEAVDEIAFMIRRLTGTNVTRFLVTSDHGFVYKRDELQVGNKIGDVSSKSQFMGKRYAVTDTVIEWTT